MNKKERKEVKKMQIMIESFGDIAKIVGDKSVLLYVDPDQEAVNRYNQILDIVQATNDFIMKIG